MYCHLSLKQSSSNPPSMHKATLISMKKYYLISLILCFVFRTFRGDMGHNFSLNPCINANCHDQKYFPLSLKLGYVFPYLIGRDAPDSSLITHVTAKRRDWMYYPLSQN